MYIVIYLCAALNALYYIHLWHAILKFCFTTGESIMQAEHKPLQFLLVHQEVVLCIHFQTTFMFLSNFFGRDFRCLIFFMRLQNRYLLNEILGNDMEQDETHGWDAKETSIASLRYQQTPCFSHRSYLQWCKVLMVPRIAISTHTGTCHWTGFRC